MLFKVAETVTKLILIGAVVVCNGWFVWWAFDNNADWFGMLVVVSFGMLLSAVLLKGLRWPLLVIAMGVGLVAGLLAVIIRALIRWGRRARQKNTPS